MSSRSARAVGLNGMLGSGNATSFRSAQAQRYMKAGVRPDPDTLVFERDGQPWNPNSFGMQFGDLAKDAKLPRV
jgi:hypothetical protein